MGNNYNEVSRLIETGQLRIISSIISPARAGSTFLEIVLAESPSIHGHSSQPFHLPYLTPDGERPGFGKPYVPPQDREDRAYGLILDKYHAASQGVSERPITLVVKEMTRNIGFGAQLERFSTLVDKHTVPIRSPQLSVESALLTTITFIEERPESLEYFARKYAEENDIRITPDYLMAFVQVYAYKEFGFDDTPGEPQEWRNGEIGLGQHWQKMLDEIRATRDYTRLNDILKAFNPQHDLNAFQDSMLEDYVRDLTDKDAKKLGFKSLNSYAKDIGYRGWQDILANTLDGETKNFDLYRPFLDKIFEVGTTGWGNADKIIGKLQADRVVIVDSTTLRAEPKRSLQTLATFLDIELSPTMVSGWTAANRDNFDREAFETDFLKAFAGAVTGDHIRRPSEMPTKLDAFPTCYKEHLLEKAYPTYIALLNQDNTIRPRGKVETQGLLSTSVTDDKQQLQDIDPIFAYSVIITDKELTGEEKREMLGAIRMKHGKKFGDVFDRVDSIVKELTVAQRMEKQDHHRVAKGGEKGLGER